MTFEDFKKAYDESVEKWRWDDPEGHTARVMYDVMGQFVESHVAGLREGLREVGDRLVASITPATPPLPPGAMVQHDPNAPQPNGHREGADD